MIEVSQHQEMTGENGDEDMTMRDYFAAAALQGILAATKDSNFSGMGIEQVYSTYARSAYKLADDMLEARRGKE